MEFTYQYTYDDKGRPKAKIFHDDPSCEMTVDPFYRFEVDKKGKKMRVLETRKVLKTIVAITTPEERRPFEQELMKIPQWYSEYLSITIREMKGAKK